MRIAINGIGRAAKLGAALFAILIVYYGGLYFLWSSHSTIYFMWMKFLGVFAWKSPFVDIIAVLSWSDCHHAGIDVLLSNSCDPLNRPLGYSPVLLDLPIYWLGVRHATAVGIVMDFAFLVMLALILRPRSRRALIVTVLACLSPAVVFALERANLDVFILTAIAAATLYATRGNTERVLSYFFYLAVGLLKYYPLVLLGLAARERPRIALAFGGAASALLIALGTHYWSRMIRVEILQAQYFGDMFGGALLPFGIAESFRLSRSVGAIIFVTLLIAAALVASRIAERFKSVLSIADWDRADFLLLAAGSALTVGCFFAGPSVGYRVTILLFVIPGLLELQSRGRDRGAQLIAFYAFGAGLLCLWRQFIERGLIGLDLIDPNSMSGYIFFLAREALWWSLVSILAAFIRVYVLHSPLWRALQAGRTRIGVS